MTLNSDLDESLRGWIAALETGDLAGREEGRRRTRWLHTSHRVGAATTQGGAVGRL